MGESIHCLDGTMYVSSTTLADLMGVKHKSLIKKIKRLDVSENFKKDNYKWSSGIYLLTQDGLNIFLLTVKGELSRELRNFFDIEFKFKQLEAEYE